MACPRGTLLHQCSSLPLWRGPRGLEGGNRGAPCLGCIARAVLGCGGSLGGRHTVAAPTQPTKQLSELPSLGFRVNTGSRDPATSPPGLPSGAFQTCQPLLSPLGPVGKRLRCRGHQQHPRVNLEPAATSPPRWFPPRCPAPLPPRRSAPLPASPPISALAYLRQISSLDFKQNPAPLALLVLNNSPGVNRTRHKPINQLFPGPAWQGACTGGSLDPQAPQVRMGAFWVPRRAGVEGERPGLWWGRCSKGARDR